MQIEKFVLISNLLSVYEPLLTKKQLDIMKCHYEEDLSLGEISEIMGISRQAVHDTIKRCEVTLVDYETKLGLWESLEKKDDVIDRLVKVVESLELGQDVKDSLLRLCEEL